MSATITSSFPSFVVASCLLVALGTRSTQTRADEPVADSHSSSPAPKSDTEAPASEPSKEPNQDQQGASPKSDAPIDIRAYGDRGAVPLGTRDSTVASYVVRGEALKRPGATAVDVISFSPGVQPTRSGAGSDLATLSVRGAPSASLPVYLAGLRLNDDVTGGADLSTVPLFALNRIEIYRGNAPADADRLGIGGAIFFEPTLPRGTHARGSAGLGSFGELKLAAAGALGTDRGGVLVSITRQNADNDFVFTDDRGTVDPADDRTVARENADYTTYDAWALGRVDLARGGRLVLMANTFLREQGVSGTTVLPARAARSTSQRQIAAASARLPCMDNGQCTVELGASAIASRRSIWDPDGELGLATRTVIGAERWQQSVRARSRIGDDWQVGATLFFGIDRLGIDTSLENHTRAARLGVTGSLNTTWHLRERISLFGLLGGEHYSPLGASSVTVDQNGGPAGRAGIKIALPFGAEAVASGGSYLRVPTLGEQFGLSATVVGNPSLLPERGYTGDLSVRFAGSARPLSVNWYADVTGFARFADNLIAYRRTSTSTIAPFNVASARSLGVELLAGAQLSSHLRAEVSISLLDPRDVTAGRTERHDQLPYQATTTTASMIEVSADPSRIVGLIDRAALSAYFRYRSGRHADTAGLRHLAEQRDLGFDASIFLFRRALALRAGVTNVLDLVNQDLLGFPLPPRAFHGSIEGAF